MAESQTDLEANIEAAKKAAGEASTVIADTASNAYTAVTEHDYAQTKADILAKFDVSPEFADMKSSLNFLKENQQTALELKALEQNSLYVSIHQAVEDGLKAEISGAQRVGLGITGASIAIGADNIATVIHENAENSKTYAAENRMALIGEGFSRVKEEKGMWVALASVLYELLVPSDEPSSIKIASTEIMAEKLANSTFKDLTEQLNLPIENALAITRNTYQSALQDQGITADPKTDTYLAKLNADILALETAPKTLIAQRSQAQDDLVKPIQMGRAQQHNAGFDEMLKTSMATSTVTPSFAHKAEDISPSVAKHREFVTSAEKLQLYSIAKMHDIENPLSQRLAKLVDAETKANGGIQQQNVTKFFDNIEIPRTELNEWMLNNEKFLSNAKAQEQLFDATPATVFNLTTSELLADLDRHGEATGHLGNTEFKGKTSDELVAAIKSKYVGFDIPWGNDSEDSGVARPTTEMLEQNRQKMQAKGFTITAEQQDELNAATSQRVKDTRAHYTLGEIVNTPALKEKLLAEDNPFNIDPATRTMIAGLDSRSTIPSDLSPVARVAPDRLLEITGLQPTQLYVDPQTQATLANTTIGEATIALKNGQAAAVALTGIADPIQAREKLEKAIKDGQYHAGGRDDNDAPIIGVGFGSNSQHSTAMQKSLDMANKQMPENLAILDQTKFSALNAEKAASQFAGGSVSIFSTAQAAERTTDNKGLADPQDATLNDIGSPSTPTQPLSAEEKQKILHAGSRG